MGSKITANDIQQAERWSGTVEREMIRRGVKNAYAAAEWLSSTNHGLDVEVTVGDHGIEPFVQLMATWGPQAEGNYATADLPVGWTTRRMISELLAIKKEFEDWLFNQGEARQPEAPESSTKYLDAFLESERCPNACRRCAPAYGGRSGITAEPRPRACGCS